MDLAWGRSPASFRSTVLDDFKRELGSAELRLIDASWCLEALPKPLGFAPVGRRVRRQGCRPASSIYDVPHGAGHGKSKGDPQQDFRLISTSTYPTTVPYDYGLDVNRSLRVRFLDVSLTWISSWWMSIRYVEMNLVSTR